MRFFRSKNKTKTSSSPPRPDQEPKSILRSSIESAPTPSSPPRTTLPDPNEMKSSLELPIGAPNKLRSSHTETTATTRSSTESTTDNRRSLRLTRSISSLGSSFSGSFRSSSTRIFLQEYDTSVDLHAFEENTASLEASISTLTWFEGDAYEAVHVIRSRMYEILRANPWLLGSLRGSSPMRLEYDSDIEPDESDLDKVFQFFSFRDDGPDLTGILVYGMELTEMIRVAQLYDLILEPAKRLVNTNKPLFKISLVPESRDLKRFALIVSLCHRIGDGCTFYSIYQMLDPNAEIHALNPVRKEDVLEGIETLMNKKMAEGVTGAFIKMIFVRDIMRSSLRNSLGAGGPSFRQRLFLIDTSYLNEIKVQHDPAECPFRCPFISTNDIIVSNCFNTSKPDFAMMAINFRGKVPNCDRYDAANYINAVIYSDVDYATPQAIRKSISGEIFEPVSGSKTKSQLNAPNNLVKDIHLSICTNWVTFAPKDGLSLGPNFDEKIHVPLKDMSYAPPNLVSNFTIFAPWKDAIGIAVSGTPDMVTEFANHPMVLREIE
jgi:hypothetical protein